MREGAERDKRGNTHIERVAHEGRDFFARCVCRCVPLKGGQTLNKQFDE